MNPYIRTLEHLSYILESVAIDAIGEAKMALRQLADLVQTDPRYSIANREEIAHRLREALELYYDRQLGPASSVLGVVSRELWKVLMDSSEAGEPSGGLHD